MRARICACVWAVLWCVFSAEWRQRGIITSQNDSKQIPCLIMGSHTNTHTPNLSGRQTSVHQTYRLKQNLMNCTCTGSAPPPLSVPFQLGSHVTAQFSTTGQSLLCFLSPLFLPFNKTKELILTCRGCLLDLMLLSDREVGEEPYEAPWWDGGAGIYSVLPSSLFGS